MKHALGGFREQFESRLVEQVGADLEVEVAGAVAPEDMPEDFASPARIVIEGAVDQFDLGNLLVDEQIEIGQNVLHGK